MMEMLNKLTDIERRVRDLEDLTEGWKKVKETTDCVVYSRPSEDFAGYIFKSEGIIPASPETVLELAAPGKDQPGRNLWDTSVDCSIVIEQPEPDIDIRMTRTLPVCMGLISAREFVDLVKIVREPNRIFTVCFGIDYPQAPRSKGVVQATNYPHGLFCYRIDGEPNKTRFIQYIHSDLGGFLPQSLIDTATPSVLASNYKQMKVAINKNKF